MGGCYLCRNRGGCNACESRSGCNADAEGWGGCSADTEVGVRFIGAG